MAIILSILLLIAGLIIMIFSAEKLVKGIINVSFGFGISAYAITAVFIGFDPENMAAGSAGAAQGLHGIAIGSVLGAVMIPSALAFGITALLVKLKYKKVSKTIVLLPIAAALLLFLVSLDGLISRFDAVVLLLGFIFLVCCIFRLAKKGEDIKPRGEVKESLEEKKMNKWKALMIMILSIIGIVVGSEMLVEGAKPIMNYFGLSDTLFGMTIIAFLISIEELAKQIPAAIKGRSDISYGNMSGSIFHFLLLNAAVIALVNPIIISKEMLYFYFPIIFLTMITISFLMLKKNIPRFSGIILILFYVIFVLKGYLF